jgi:AcrR family transcriptional regulator
VRAGSDAPGPEPDSGAGGNGTADRLLTTAAMLFRTKGYAATGIREIAASVGIQSASLYHHVGKKEDLLYQLCVDTLTRATQALRQAVDRETDPVERVRAIIRVHLVTNLADQDKHTAALMELRSLSSERRAAVLRLRHAYEDAVRQVLVDVQAAGACRDDVPAKYLTLHLLGLLNWPVFWYRPDGDLTSAQIADQVAALFLDGVRREGPPSRALRPAARRPSAAGKRRTAKP